jgi:hypothetical protein
VLEIDEGTATPKLLVKFIASDQTAGLLEEEGKNSERLSLQPQPDTMLSQFPGHFIESEWTKYARPRKIRPWFPAHGSSLSARLSVMRSVRKFLEFRNFSREAFWSEI